MYEYHPDGVYAGTILLNIGKEIATSIELQPLKGSFRINEFKFQNVKGNLSISTDKSGVRLKAPPVFIACPARKG